jgi:alkylation response protein AidB-like acyl-CoA dehydrogenase
VFHFPVSLKAEGVRVLDTWRAHGMRGTGSHDVMLEGVFIPDAIANAGVQRPAGKWHPFFHTVALVALPVFYSAYLGVAEAARDLALRMAGPKRQDPLIPLAIGDMENQLVTAQIAHASMVELVKSASPGPATTVAAAARRTILGNALIHTVEKAMAAVGGAGFYREAGLERAWRDIQAARYHPITERAQQRLTGRYLLGLDIDE